MLTKQVINKNVIKVYSTPTCPYCIMAKTFLKEHKLPFEDIDVSMNQKAAEEMIKLTGQMGVPVLVINGKVIIGFNKPALMQALGIKE
jgi:glutaredoxin-like YruB-family protein